MQFSFLFWKGEGNGEGKKGVVIFLRGSSLAVDIDLKQQNWESGCAEEEGYHCGIPGLVAMATWSRGLGPPLPWLGAAGGPGSGAQLLSRIPPLSRAAETWAEGHAVSRWVLGNPIPSPALSHCRRGPFSWNPNQTPSSNLLPIFKALIDKVYHGHVPRSQLFKKAQPPMGLGAPALEDTWGNGLICLFYHPYERSDTRAPLK